MSPFRNRSSQMRRRQQRLRIRMARRIKEGLRLALFEAPRHAYTQALLAAAHLA